MLAHQQLQNEIQFASCWRITSSSRVTSQFQFKFCAGAPTPSREIQFTSLSKSNSSSSCWHSTTCIRYNSRSHPIRIRTFLLRIHAGGTNPTRRVLSNSNCSSSYRHATGSHRSRRQFVFPSISRYNSRFPPIRVLHDASALAPARDTIRVSLPFELSFVELILERQLELEIHFVCISNCSSSCWRGSFSSRKQFAFPSIRTFLLGIHASVPTLTRDTIRVSLQFAFPSNSRFPPIRVSLQFAFPPNSRFSQLTCAPASTRENNSRSSPNPFLIRHAIAPAPSRENNSCFPPIRGSIQFAFPHNSRSRQSEFEFFMQFLPQFEFLIMLYAEIQFVFSSNSNSSSSAFASNSRSSSNPLLIHHAGTPAPARENNSRSPQFEFDIHVSAPTPARVSPQFEFFSMLGNKLQLEIQFAFSSNSPNSNSGPSCWRTNSSSSSPPNPTHRHDAGAPAPSGDTLRVSNSRSSLGHQLPREIDFPLQFQFPWWCTRSSSRKQFAVPSNSNLPSSNSC